jgi:hypothetical protein
VAAGVNTGSASFNLSGPGSKSSSFNGDFLGALSGSCSGGGCSSASPSGFYTAGHAGPVGYELSVFQGLVNGTKAGDVAFLNAYLASNFTPGALPTGPMQGMVAYANNSPARAGITGTGTGTFSGNNLIAYSAGPFSGTLGTGTVVEISSIATVDGGTMNWGRWSGTGHSVVDTNGLLSNPSSGVPYVVGTTNTVLPISGSFTYSYAGGPNPVNALGQVGVFNGGAFLVNFSAGGGTFSISTPLSMTVGLVNYLLTTCQSGCAISGVTLGGASPTNFTGTCSGGACSASTPIATAGAGGIFLGPQGAGLAVSGNIFSPAPAVAYAGAFKR